MQRNVKPGITFYRMDSDHIGNKKVRLLMNEFDSDGYYIWQCILSHGYGKWGYYFDYNNQEDIEFFASDFAKKKLSLVKEVVNGCLKRGLFDKTVFQMFGILTCEMMQSGYVIATTDRRKKGSVFYMREDWLLIDFEGNIPTNIKLVPGENIQIPGEREQNSREDAADKDKTKTRQDKDKKVSAPITSPPPKKVSKVIEETEPYWKELVAVWFDFNKEKFNDEPSFVREDPKILKRIIGRLKQRSERKNQVWNEESAPKRLRYFLDSCFSDKWLSEHFLLKNLETQFDKVVLNQTAAASNKPSASGSGLQYLYERFLEGKLDTRVITEEHFKELERANAVQIDDDVIKRRIKSLADSNIHSECRLYQDYSSGAKTKEIEEDKISLMRIAVILHFRKLQSEKITTVSNEVHA